MGMTATQPAWGDETEVPREGTELVIGLVGAIGTELDAICEALEKHLRGFRYDVKRIGVMELVQQHIQTSPEFDSNDAFKRYMARMDAGNRLRLSLCRNDAVALLAIAAIRVERLRSTGNENKPANRCAFVIKSLKHPEEVKALRATYGKNCLILSAYSPRHEREKSLASRIAKSIFDPSADRHIARAHALICRDDVEIGFQNGQNVRDTFPLADAFVDARSSAAADQSVGRFLDLVFGHPFATPTRAEFAMFQAHGAGMRSSSEGRQVGAAIVNDDGDILALGTNEVARAFGGQYWGEDGPAFDHRDFTRRSDSTSTMVDSILADLFARAKKCGWLEASKSTVGVDQLVEIARQELLPAQQQVDENDRETLHQKALIQSVIEYLRPVHAEMAALMTAARLGVSVRRATLYCTTFPCHECAKHIVAAGIGRVIFIEPYPKSRVAEMYDDSISVDERVQGRIMFEAFVGIAPARYVELFTAPQRKIGGKWVNWELEKQNKVPRNAQSHLSYIKQEDDKLDILNKLLTSKGLKQSSVR